MRKNSRQIIVFILTISFLLISYNGCHDVLASPPDYTSFPLHKNHPIIISAINYLKKQQAPDGSIGGFSVSPWVSMAFASVDDNSESFDRITQYLFNSMNNLNNSLKATDWQRHILGLAARNNFLVQSKKEFFTEKIMSFYTNNQFGEEQNIYDDCFGIFVLSCLTNSSINQTIQSNLKYSILNMQKDNGGWNDVDTTALALMALNIVGEPKNSSYILNAVNFLKNNQHSSGGFTSWGSTNTASTAWALSALTTLNTSFNEFIWNSSVHNAVDFLLSMQQPNGSFNYTNSSALNPEWMTAYAIIALRGKSYPVTFLFSDNTQDDNSNTDGDSDDVIDEENDKTDDVPRSNDNLRDNQPYFYVDSPVLTGIHFNDKFIQMPTKKPVLIGVVNFSIRTNASIDFVAFYINNGLYHIDSTYPYNCTYRSENFCKYLKLTVQGFSIQKNITIEKLAGRIILLKNAQEKGHFHSYLKEVNMFKNWLFPNHYVDTHSYWYFNY